MAYRVSHKTFVPLSSGEIALISYTEKKVYRTKEEKKYCPIHIRNLTPISIWQNIKFFYQGGRVKICKIFK